MNPQTEKLLNTGLTLVRDAGSAAAEKIADTGTSLVRAAAPKAGKLAKTVKEAVSVGAAVAIAKKGGKAAISAAKKNPVAVAAGAVALAGLGVAVAVARKRKKARDAAGGGAKPKTVAAKNMRANGAAPAKKAAAKKSTASRARKSAGATKH